MQNYYEVLTEDGFKDFYTVSMKTVDSYATVYLDIGATIRCTLDHLFKTSDGFKPAKSLTESDTISPSYSKVSYVDITNEPLEVYDLVDVVDGNHYLTNGVTSHNCMFISSDHTLFDSYHITQAELTAKRRVEDFTRLDDKDAPGYMPSFPYRIAGHKFWKKLDPSKTYLVGVDPATGSGEDYTVFQVFEFPSLIQVMEYRTNTMSSPVAYTQLKNLLKFLESYTKEVYFSIENNGVGNGMISLYEADETPPVHAHFVSEPGGNKLGMFTTAATKIRAALKFKELFERGQMTLNSEALFHEMKNYVRKDGAYAANVGAHDDTISAILIIFRILQEMSTYDDNAYVKMYTVESEIEMEGKWEYSEDDTKNLRDEYDYEEIPMPFILS